MAKAGAEALAWVLGLVPETRADPWRWYCWTCTAGGEADERADRDALGLTHVRIVHQSAEVESDTYGRLMHVWPPEDAPGEAQQPEAAREG